MQCVGCGPTEKVLPQLQVVEVEGERLPQLVHILHIELHSEEHCEGGVVRALGPGGRGILHQFALVLKKDIVSICEDQMEGMEGGMDGQQLAPYSPLKVHLTLAYS